MVAFTLVLIGALNWGLVGLFGFNLVNTLLSGMPMLENMVYDLVGLSAVLLAVNHKKECLVCMGKMKK